jgi:hypothetical protein
MRAGTISCMLLLGVIFMSIICGCNGSGHSGENPVIPNDESILRGGMHFYETVKTIFGADDPASDVDLASVRSPASRF